MCLITDNPKPKIATKDIEAHKILLFKHGKYYAPFNRLFEYMKGVNHPQNCVLTQFDNYYSRYDERNDNYVIDEGYLHAFTINNPHFRYYADDLQKRLMSDDGYVVIAKMTIPKGAKYYLSTDDMEICSNALCWSGDVIY